MNKSHSSYQEPRKIDRNYTLVLIQGENNLYIYIYFFFSVNDTLTICCFNILIFGI